MAHEPQRSPPQSTVQAAGQAASDVIGGLRQSPMLLALVVLNIVGIGAALWVLKDLGTMSDKRFSEVMKLTQQCFEAMDVLPPQRRGSRNNPHPPSDSDPQAGPG